MLNPGEPPRGYKALELCGAAPQQEHAGSFGRLKVRGQTKRHVIPLISLITVNTVGEYHNMVSEVG